MSLHYFIDAYNVLHSTDRWDHIPRAERREHFLKFIEDEHPTGSQRNSVTVVFDGHGPRLGAIQLTFVRVLFSGDKDADTVIKEHVDELPSGRTAVVVTNDRGLQQFVKGAGAAIMSCEDFLRRRTQPNLKKPAAKEELVGAGAINAELSRLWKVN
jgi:predicted RNA-binding protein with PIN domain